MKPFHSCKAPKSGKVHISAPGYGTMCGYTPTRTGRGVNCKLEPVHETVTCHMCLMMFDAYYHPEKEIK